MSNHTFDIWADGGSRGNPGPAAYGFIIKGPGLGTIEHGEVIGRATNNVAEYSGVIGALKKLKSELGTKKSSAASVLVHADSELLVKQMNGEYRVKDANLRELYMEIHNIIIAFEEVSFTHVRREKNKDADRMVNQALDHEQKELDL